MSFKFENKNVVFLLGSPELGGAERQAIAFAGFLQNNLQCNVYIYACVKRKPSVQFNDFLKTHNINHFFTEKNPLVAGGYFKTIKIKLKLLLFMLKIKKHKPDIVIPYLNKSGIIASSCKRLLKNKVTFFNNRGHEIYRGDTIEKLAIAKTDFFLVNSLDSIEDIVNNFYVSSNDIYFIPNFSTNFSELKDTEYREKDDIIIGMLAHFREEKHHGLLLSAFNELAKIHKNIKLHLVGSAFNENMILELKDFVKQNKLDSRVEFLHGMSGEDTIPSFDIAVLVSEKEGMSNSIMEYMFFKKPIVCTNHSGSKFLLGDKKGFLIENNKELLVTKLNELILNPKIREDEGIANRERVIKDFSISSYILKLEFIINKYI